MYSWISSRFLSFVIYYLFLRQYNSIYFCSSLYLPWNNLYSDHLTFLVTFTSYQKNMVPIRSIIFKIDHRMSVVSFILSNIKVLFIGIDRLLNPRIWLLLQKSTYKAAHSVKRECWIFLKAQLSTVVDDKIKVNDYLKNIVDYKEKVNYEDH